MITSVEIVANNPNKATVINETGVVYVDQLFWNTTSANGRLFTLLHEQGHLANDSDSEFEADDYAKAEMLKLGHSERHIVKAAQEVFAGSPDTNFRLQRLRASANHVVPPAVFGMVGNVLGDLVGLIGRGKREKAAHAAANERYEQSMETAEDIAIMEARARQDRLRETLKVVGLVALLIAAVVIVLAVIKSNKPKIKKLEFPPLPPGYKLAPVRAKLIS